MKSITNRRTNDLLFSGEYSSTKELLLAALSSGANLRNASLYGADLRYADLCGANLRNADLRNANLRNANLCSADLCSADLCGTDLRNASLYGADLRNANLRYANLCSADLCSADLCGTDLRYADLCGANLRNANLEPIRRDLYEILEHAQAEAPGLLAALKEGRVEGAVYRGECACLVGTIANLRNVDINKLYGINPDSDRPVEIFFLGIEKGDTPGNSQLAAMAVQWIEEWIAAHPQNVERGVES